MRFSRAIKVVVAFVIVIVGGYLAARFTGKANGIPNAFSDARLQGALIAQNIVNLSSTSVYELQRINELDREQKYTEALHVAIQTAAKSKEIRDEAVKLSQELEKMTRALSDIRPDEARHAALESISNRLALITHLINYSAYLGELLEALRTRFSGAPLTEDVAVLVVRVNAEVTEINNFNARATEAMERFDAIIREK